MGWRWTSLAFLLGGCSQIFSLDTPDLMIDAAKPVIDTDGDGIVDDADNCPMVKNPDQTDTDRNNVGDICEGCTMLPLRASDDDDSDMIKDNVDNCFGLSGMQSDADNDGIGGGCDPRVGLDARFCVWTFRDPAAGEDPSVWTSAWQLSGTYGTKDGALVHTSSTQQETAILRAAPIESTSGIAFDMHILLTTFTTPMTIGFGFEQQQTSGTTLYTCQVVQSNTTSSAVVQLLKDSQVVGVQMLPGAISNNLGAYARMSAINVNGMLEITCSMVPDMLPSYSIMVMSTEPTQTVKLKPRLFADRANVDVHHVALYKLGIAN